MAESADDFEIDQQFGTIDINGIRIDVMMCIDPDLPDTAFMYAWSGDQSPVGFSGIFDRSKHKILKINFIDSYAFDKSGIFNREERTQDLINRLDQINVSLQRQQRGFKGVWNGPKGTGVIRLKPKPRRPRKEAYICESWDDFKRWASRNRLNDKILFYRGHGDSKFEIKTSFHRTGRQRLDRFISGDLATFHNHAQTVLNRSINVKDGLEYATLLALAQHHGLPTPMLDATRSPYIAAFFAFSDYLENIPYRKPRSTHVRVYGFTEQFVASLTQPSVMLHYPRPYISPLRVSGLHNPRLSAQQGEFLVTNIVDLESQIYEIEESTGYRCLVATDIPTDCAIEALEDLSYMGLTAETMFPGLDGICRMLKQQSHFVRRPLETTVEPPVSISTLPTNDSIWGNNS